MNEVQGDNLLSSRREEGTLGAAQCRPQEIIPRQGSDLTAASTGGRIAGIRLTLFQSLSLIL